jgi:hypothetical protein
MKAEKPANARVGGGKKVHATYAMGNKLFTRCGAEGVTVKPSPLHKTTDPVSCQRCKQIIHEGGQQ